MKLGFKFKSITSKKFRELLHDFNGQMDFDLSKRFLGDIYVLSDGRVIQAPSVEKGRGVEYPKLEDFLAKVKCTPKTGPWNKIETLPLIG
jgi:hypothetical protein